MASQDAQDRNLPATARRIRRAREDGQVARSRDLGHFAALAATGMLLVGTAPMLAGWLRDVLAASLRLTHASVAAPEAMAEQLGRLSWAFVLLVVPLGALTVAVALLSGVLAGGWNFTWKALHPTFSKVDPLAGLGRIFSKHQLTETLKASGLALVLGAIGALYLQAHLDDWILGLAMPLPAAVGHVTGTLYGGLAFLVLALAAFAAIDVPLQRKLLLDRLKMSHQELKQEFKEVEGNQEVKAKIKVRMREMSRQRMLAAVPQADLVVMNPTHFAVALKYDETRMAAPRVVAKGADLLAFAIRDLARESRVPVLQMPPLARALYTHAEVDQEIPAALFAAVAQVLAYVYQLRAALAGRGAMPPDLGDVEVPPGLDPLAAARGAAEGGAA